jgi:hypothetical protein
VRIFVYNLLLGKNAELVYKNISAGNFKENLKDSNLAIGMYMYKILVGCYAAVRKMLFLK